MFGEVSGEFLAQPLQCIIKKGHFITTIVDNDILFDLSALAWCCCVMLVSDVMNCLVSVRAEGSCTGGEGESC